MSGALSMAGCAGLPASAPPAWPSTVPVQWRTALAAPPPSPASAAPAAEPAPVDRTWRLDDLLLEQLLAQASQANPRIDGARAALRQARAVRTLAAASLWPGVEASASTQASRSGTAASQRSVSASLDAAWTLDVFGANRDAVALGDAAAQAAAADLAGVQAEIATELTQAYLVLRSAQARRAIAAHHLASLQDTLQITRWRIQAGLLTELEGLQALAATEQAAAQLPAWQALIEQTAQALSVLTGQPPAALLADLAQAADLPAALADPTLGLPLAQLQRRPDVQAAGHRVRAAQAGLAQAEAARLPNFTLTGSLGLSALTLGSLSGASPLVRALAGRVAVPLFDGGAATAQVAVQQATLDQSLATWRATLGAALHSVEDARADLQNHRGQQAHLQRAAEAASQAAVLASQRYTSGLVDHATVLETQRTRLATQDGLAANQALVRADQVRLAAALGLSWQGAPQPAPPEAVAWAGPATASRRPDPP